jgi:TonB-dependent SusC/RagA subfamily outer membrane receptor
MKKLVLKITGFLFVMLLFTSTVFAQSRTITGTVVDSESQPVIGAVVNEMGTSNGTVTGSDGSFSITSSSSDVKLKISYVGFTTQTINVGSQTNLSVKMSSDESLSEVVVTAAGVKRASRSVGYALSSVSAKEITEGGDRSVLNGMQGKVAGVTINSASSNPGASTRIVIRGVQSISQGNQPLIVIDGVPMTNSSVNSTSLNGGFDFGNGLNAVNPDDIENIQILKGSSASALYGSRAANGVVLITTKKGSTSSKGKKSNWSRCWIRCNLQYSASFT